MKHSERIEEIMDRRRRFAAVLRSERHSQCQDVYTDGMSFCFWGLYAFTIVGHTRTYLTQADEGHFHWAEGLGLTKRASDTAVHLNDSGRSFSEMADWLEAQPIHIEADG